MSIKALVEEKSQAVKARDAARMQIYPLWDKCDMPNQELEQQIRVSICGVEYCSEDWLGSSVGPDHPDNDSEKCDDFDPKGHRCTNTKCPVYAAHCAYFDARDSYNNLIATRRNRVRRFFGLREKQ